MELFGEKRILTVSQLTGLIRGVLEENFEHVWVEGEISNLAMPASGHLYFTLKDAGAQLRCVMFRASVRALKFKPRDGMGLIVRGRLTVYDQRGDYQLLVEYLEPQGLGALQMAFIQLKERLAKEGLFAEEHKKPLPRLPRRIGIVTSATGAAIHDMLNVLNRRFANLEILLYPVRVQGEGAAAEIAGAIRDFNRLGAVDVLIVGRGGGSLEDLWAFNEEVVARAIHQSRIPVISAVGHEVDFTIADFVADLRAPTPSAAAELVVRSKSELVAEVDSLSHRLRQTMEHRLAGFDREVQVLSRSLKDPTLLLGHLAQRIDDLAGRLNLACRGGEERRRQLVQFLVNRLRLQNPAVEVERGRELLLGLANRAERSMVRRLDSAREGIAVGAGKLEALSPLATLARGYAIANLLPEGVVIRESSQLAAGDRLRLRLFRGSALCRVDSCED
ncbi:exodeoxyribonuclease VII large subunit [Geobacter sp. AOG1]|uniref:exodeoxyribonuclease VII large subunit n=1 Tax=Geobacter sp. AOG1 TaxID=1566346 RepID=UPI001CC52DD5|nr:exodeoxyribonuclease VII large subunit [Geobacter sp. AOG1]GFE58948.1 exodeoxyribonuclease 7 large subunit [Geobacter sp. AOG1]